MRFQAAFEVLPVIDIAGYDQVKVDRPNTNLDDAEFEAELVHLRDSHAIMEPVEEDRPLVDGDFAQIRFTGSTSKAAWNRIGSPSTRCMLVTCGWDTG